MLGGSAHRRSRPHRRREGLVRLLRSCQPLCAARTAALGTVARSDAGRALAGIPRLATLRGERERGRGLTLRASRALARSSPKPAASSANRPRGACCGCVSTAMRPLFRSHCGATFEAAGAQRCSVDRAAGIRSQRALETGAGRLLWQAPAHDLLDSIRGACSRDRLDELIGGDQCLHSAEHAAIRCKQQQLGGAGLMLPHELLRLRAADIGDQKVH